jgi:hypothetical protein
LRNLVKRTIFQALSICAAVAGCATGAAPTTDPPVSTLSRPTSWPPLPTKYVIGRAATVQDVRTGHAVFAAQTTDMPPPVALQIGVPQYAYCRVDGKEAPGILVQAERAGGMDVVGFRPLAGTKAYVAPLGDCRLLGPRPSAPP